MSWNLSLSEPSWLITVCIAVGIAYAAVLYRRTKQNDLFAEYPNLKWVLPAARAILVALLCFFLLGPFSNKLTFKTEKPILALAVDNSLSVKTAAEQAKLKEKLNKLKDLVADKFQIDVLSVGQKVQLNEIDSLRFDEQATDYSSLLTYLKNEYQDQNLNLCLLVGDGIYTKGANPEYKSQELNFPIFTSGLGDTNELIDVGIENTFFNSIAYLGNDYPVQIDVKATGLMGKRCQLSILSNKGLVHERQLSFNSDKEFQELKFTLKANKLGVNRIDVKIQALEEDQNLSNNQFVFYVDVIESRKRIELWTNTSHPDIGALRFLVGSNDNYSFKLVKSTTEQLADKQDLVILYDWFSNGMDLSLYENLKAKSIPCLLVFGDNFNSTVFNRGSQNVQFNALGSGSNQALPLINPVFDYFDMDEELKSTIRDWSPLKVPFGKFQAHKEGDIVLKQGIGVVETNEPLILLRNERNYRYGIIAGSGFWQWRLLDYQKQQEHRLIGEFTNQILQYLTVKESKKLLQVSPNKKVASASEDVVLKAQLYNASLQAVSNAEIQISIKSENGNAMERVMSSFSDKYSLKLNNLEPGTYTFNAKTNIGGQLLTDNGYFTVVDNQLELMNLSANFKLLKSISANSNGSYVPFENLERFAQDLLAMDDFNSIIKEENKWKELINFKWIFWLVLALLSLEWFSRKFIGSY